MIRAVTLSALALATGLAGCGRMDHFGKPPSFTPNTNSAEHVAMLSAGLPRNTQPRSPTQQASLWNHGPESLLGDRRAVQKGDILTVVIEIDEKAEISNDTNRSRSGSESMGVPDFFGVPQRIDRHLPEGASMANAVGINSDSATNGKGSVKRNEKLELKVAATVIDVLPNGILSIAGSQEVRVNFEMRELLVTGFVRPEDISRLNQITYDKIASARISYGGRGQITDVQQPRYGQQVLDMILPF
ncbi:flagellar basal body L-ring protein FlgH [Chachezhania sediminis]|uniref:flagellar basal body L-ring protein FlgH n=1 Tax=Chachezhania sediminis TaxID=2599291 RepID=UPI00131BF88E|nr:flagellar basal body L-ring protein FlgH [Chachezhania sediminis]